MRLGDMIRQPWYVQVACVGGSDGAAAGEGDVDRIDCRLFVDDPCSFDREIPRGP